MIHTSSSQLHSNQQLANASPLRRDAAALVIFFALTIVMTNPLAFHLASAVEDKQDALLNTWIIAWVGHALVTDPTQLFNANIFYPYPNTLAFSETMLPQGILALPFNLAFDNTALGHNVVLLFSFFFAAYAMYLFVFHLTRQRSAAIVAGTIFAFNPYNLGNLAQVQLLSFGWLPLAMIYLRRLMRRESEKHKAPSTKLNLRASFLFALFFSLQALASFYYAFLAGLAVVLYIIWHLIAHHSAISPKPPRSLAPRLLELAVSLVLIALIVTPFFLPYLQVQRDLGFERKVEESEPFSASLNLYTEVAPQNALYGTWLAPRPPIFNGGYPLDNLFPGLIASVLAFIGVTATKRRERWFYILLLASSFTLSLGPRLYLTPNQPTDLALPYRWLYDLFPLMRALRAPVRFDALVMFAMAVLAGVACSEWRVARWSFKIRNSHLPWRVAPGKFQIQITHLLVPLIAIEYLALPAAQVTSVPVGDAIPPYAQWLAKEPNGIVLELPMMASDPSKPLDLTAQYLATYHWQKTPDGYSGFNPPARGEIAYEMKAFPNDRSIALLQALDVQYVVIHSNHILDWSTQRDKIGRAAELQMVQQFGTDYVYRVSPRVTTSSALDARLYLPSPTAPSQPYTAFLVVENRGQKPFAIKPTDVVSVKYAWKEQQPAIQLAPVLATGETNASFPLLTSSVSVVPIRLSVPTRTNPYHLDLSISNRSMGDWNLSGEVVVKGGEAARQIVIPGGVSLHTPLKPEYTRGDSIPVDLTWLPYNKVDAYYSASVRVVNARGEKIAAQDREPIVSTFLWTPGVSVQDRFTLVLPQDIAPGEYAVELLMYQAEQGTEVLLLDENYAPRETITLSRFTVK